MAHNFEKFRENREKGNQAVLDTKNLTTKRIFSLDKQAYNDGALDKGTKELLGLVASMVLRCNDCIDYHLQTTVEQGYNKQQIDEAMGIALLVGGSIVIPHMRHASESLEFLFAEVEK